MKLLIEPSSLKGSVNIIPSKSHAHRLILAQKLAIIQGSTDKFSLDIPAFCEDIKATKLAISGFDSDSPIIDCKESASTLRFLLPIIMALKEDVVFKGSGSLPNRPISPLLKEMEKHGCLTSRPSSVHLNSKSNEICTIKGTLSPGKYTLPGNISSQFVTGLLFALPLLNKRSIIKLTTPLESSGYVDMTLDVLRDFQIKIDVLTSSDGLTTYKINGNQKYIIPKTLELEADWSNAAFWLVAGALGGDITCKGLSLTSSQPDKAILSILKKMGATITIGSDGIRCKKNGHLQGGDWDLSQYPDLFPAVCVLASYSKGQSRLFGIERLQIKESNRIEAMEACLCGLGATAISKYFLPTGNDIITCNEKEKGGRIGLLIVGYPEPPGGIVSSFKDHRIAMAAAIASCNCTGTVTLWQSDVVKKSDPTFFDVFTSLGGKIKDGGTV